MRAGAALRYRADYRRDPAMRAALERLLHDVFALDLRTLDDFDARDPSYTPFSYFDASGCVANVGVFTMPMMLRGRRVDALAIQSVAVRLGYRGCGLCRDLLTRALAWCDARAPLVLLRTAIPDLYVRFGFRAVPEFTVVGPPPIPDARGKGSARRLHLRADLALVKKLLKGRTAVSDRAGLLDHGTMFLLNTAAMDQVRLHHVSVADAIVVTEMTSGTLRLLDVVGREIPSLAHILAALSIRPERVEISFPPDKLDYAGELRPVHPATGLMARGPFVDSTERFMLPPTAAF